MKRFLVLALLAAAAAGVTAGEAADGSREEHWVCVPSREGGWLCGQGLATPVQTPLPEPEPPAPPPPGYTAPSDSAQLPRYLLVAPAEDGEQESAPTADVRETDTGPVEPAPPEPAPRETSPPPAEGPRYGVQLLAARQPETLDAFLKRHDLDESGLLRRQWRDDGGPWHVLILGSHRSVAAAREALAGLPPQLREAGAWVRRVDTLDIPARERESD